MEKVELSLEEWAMFADALTDGDFIEKESDAMPRYTGRGMYGGECVAFLLSGDVYPALLRFGFRLTEVLAAAELDLEPEHFFDDAWVDNLGCEHVLYFPAIAVVADAEVDAGATR
jgi:hypothetical protein